MRARRALLAALASGLLLGAGPGGSGPQGPSVIPVEEIAAGQRGYGLSVFSGTEPERFEVEVVGVLRNPSPGTDFILARLTGRDLEQSGVIAGMSGSPVYLDGRLAGAVAFGWPFSREALAGIVPIGEMRAMAEVAAAEAPGGERGAGAPAQPRAAGGGAPPAAGGGPLVELRRLAAGEVPEDLLSRALAGLRAPLPAGASPFVQWLAGGFGPRSSALLEAGLGPLALAGGAPAGQAPAGGTAPAGAEAGLVPGGAVAAVVVDGDLRLAATGTVTDRDGDRLLAFGHPVFGLGPISVPLAEAEVVAVVKSLSSSFKVANVGPVRGSFAEDRRAGLVGHLGREARTIPLTVRMSGEAESRFAMRVAEVPGFTPSLVASAVLGVVEAGAWRSGEQGIDLDARFAVAGHGTLEVRQSFDGANAAVQAASFMLAVADYLVSNDLEKVVLEGVEVALRQVERPRSATLVGAHAEHTVVRPGDRVRVNVDLVAFRGGPFRKSLEVTLPHDLPAGRYTLMVGDGSSVDAARLSAQPAEPVNLRQALALLSSLHSRRDLVVLGLSGGRGLSVAGQPMPRLPGSVRSLWGTLPAGGAVPLKLFVAQEQVVRLEQPIAGLVRLDLEVRRREAVAAAPEEGQSGPDAGAAAEAEPDEPPAPEPPRKGGGGGAEGSGEGGKSPPGGEERR